MLPIPSFLDEKPLETRKIPIKYSSYRGLLSSTKLHSLSQRPRPRFPYESNLERDFYICLDHDAYCTEIIPQPYIWVEDDNGNKIRYAVDCWASFFTGNQWKVFLYEVKMKSRKEKLDKTKKNWILRNKLLKNYCEKQNEICKEHKRNIEWKYKVITEEHIYNNRFNNIMKFRSAVVVQISQNYVKQGRLILENIFQKDDEFTFQEIKQRIKRKLKKLDRSFSEALIRNVIYYHIYYQLLWIDWDQPFSESNTLIYKNFDHHIRTVPFFDVSPAHLTDTSSFPEVFEADFNLAEITEEQEKIALNRQDIISGLYDFTSNKRKKSSDDDIKKHRLNYERDKNTTVSVSVRTIRRWLRSYEESGGD